MFFIFSSEKNVLGFQIPVKIALTMHVLTSLDNLPHNMKGLLISKFSLGLEVVIESASLAILCDDHKLFGVIVFAGDKLEEEGV